MSEDQTQVDSKVAKPKPSLSYISQELAKCLEMFSLDVIGIIANYSLELRSLYSVVLNKDMATQIGSARCIMAYIVVTSKQHLVVFSDQVYVYDAITMKRLKVFEYPRNLSFISVTIDLKTDIIYAIVCKHKKEMDRTYINETRYLYKIVLPMEETAVVTYLPHPPKIHTIIVRNVIDIKKIFPRVCCIHHCNDQLIVATANVFYILNDWDLHNIPEKHRNGTAYFNKELRPTYETGLGSDHVRLAVDPTDSSIYFTEYCTNAVRNFRPNSKHSTVWLPKDSFSCSGIKVLRSGHVIGLVQRSSYNLTAVELFDSDGLVLDSVMRPPMNTILVKDVADRIYFFNDRTMFVMVV